MIQMSDIIIGRNEEELKTFGTGFSAFVGKHYVKTGDEVNLSGRVLLDLAKPHVIMVCGKRGTGKSYTLGMLA